MNVTHTVLSKRKLLRLVEEGVVAGPQRSGVLDARGVHDALALDAAVRELGGIAAIAKEARAVITTKRAEIKA